MVNMSDEELKIKRELEIKNRVSMLNTRSYNPLRNMSSLSFCYEQP
jgi:hypothetical protein